MAEEAEDILEDDGADGLEDGGSKRKKLILFIVYLYILCNFYIETYININGKIICNMERGRN